MDKRKDQWLIVCGEASRRHPGALAIGEHGDRLSPIRKLEAKMAVKAARLTAQFYLSTAALVGS
jgi:hypothetical protein